MCSCDHVKAVAAHWILPAAKSCHSRNLEAVPNPQLSHLIRTTHKSPPHRVPTEWLVPVLLIAGFLILAAVLFRDRLMPGPLVDVGRVLAIPVAAEKPIDAAQGSVPPAEESLPTTPADSNTPLLFQASGWLEPSPYPIRVATLVSGVVKTVKVKEGDAVNEGEELATLIDDDARLAVESARNAQVRALAEVLAAESELEAARNRFGAQTARADTEKAKLEETRDLHARFEGLSDGAVSEIERVVAKLAVVRADASLAEQAALATEAASDITRRERLLEVARSNVKSAAVGLAAADLAMARTRIVAPITGRVQRLLVMPGTKLVVDGDDSDSALVAVLYNPQSLQARVDVALADAANLSVGQATRIRCSLLPDTVFHGVVTNLAGQADVQRNTLQVKVAIHDPDSRMRPEMLCRVEFLAPRASQPGRAQTGENTSAVRSHTDGVHAVDIYVPEAALINFADKSANAWVVDPESLRSTRRTVTLSTATRDGHRQVLDGLLPGEWVVLRPGNALAEGDRVSIANKKGTPSP